MISAFLTKNKENYDLKIHCKNFLKYLRVSMHMKKTIILFFIFTGKLLLKDPKLAASVFFGPVTPYQYRVMGPGKWQGAREAIFTQMERVDYPFATRPLGFKIEKDQKKSFWKYCFYFLILALLVQFIFR